MPRHSLKEDVCPNPTKNPKCTGKAGHRGLCQSCAMLAAWARRRAGGASTATQTPVAGSATTDRGFGLEALTVRIEAEMSALVNDCQGVIEGIRAEIEAVRRRNIALLKFAILSRRRIGRLKKTLRNARSEARAARLAEEADADEKDAEDEDEEA